MRIAWIADYKLSEHLGGAQHTNAKMIEYGEGLGYNIIQIEPRAFDCGFEADLVIINNIMNFRIEDIIKVAQRIPTIRYEHDRECSIKYPQIYDYTIQNIFLSPLHKSICEGNAKKELKGVCIPSPIDSSVFNLEGVEKEKDSVLWVGSVEPHKGFDKVVEYAKEYPQKRFYIVSFDYKEQELPSNMEFLGEKHGSELALVYKKCEELYHHPQHEAFGRTVMEAYLCGCKLNVNENVGAMSYDWDFNDYELIKNKLYSEPVFWGEIFKYLPNNEKGSNNTEQQ